MSLSCKLWSGTGLVHCLVGLAVPELRGPLLRVIREGTVEAANLEERHARGAAVWFHLFGGMVFLQGLAWKQYARETNAQELPRWWGWSVTGIAIARHNHAAVGMATLVGARCTCRMAEPKQECERKRGMTPWVVWPWPMIWRIRPSSR